MKGVWFIAIACLLISANLRPSITAVGPLLDDIRDSTGMSAGMAGLLTTLPLLAFGLVSPAGPAVGRWLGIERGLLAAMVLLTAALVARSLGPTAVLLGATAVAGVAMAVGNVLVPALVKQDLADRTGPVMAAFSTMLAATAGLASGVAVPLADAGLGWRGSLAVWAAPAAVAAVVWGPHALRHRRAAGEGVPERAVPMWRSPVAWWVSAFFGFQALLFYSGISWLVAILEDDGMATDTAGWMLALMQLVSLAATSVVPLLATRRPDQRAIIVGSLVLFAAGGLGFALFRSDGIVLWVTLMGLASGAQFSLGLTFLVLRASDAASAASLSGMAQSVGYLLAGAGPIGIGLMYDATGGWGWPLAGLGLVLVGVLLTGLRAADDRRV